MKDGDELYKKYYGVYKSDHDTDDELNEVKKKKMDYKQFELFDKTDKKLKLDEETKNFIKEIKKQEKGVDKKGFMEYFNYKPTALVNKLLGQNTQFFLKVWTRLNKKRLN